MEQWSTGIEWRNPEVVEKPVSLLLLLYIMQTHGLVTGYSPTVPTVPIPRTAISCLLTPSKATDWQFPTNANVKQVATSWLQMLDTDFFSPRRHTSFGAMMDGCFECQWWHYEVWCVPSASHVPCVHQGRSKVSHSRVFVTKDTLSQILLKTKFCHNLYNHDRINNYKDINGKKVNL